VFAQERPPCENGGCCLRVKEVGALRGSAISEPAALTKDAVDEASDSDRP